MTESTSIGIDNVVLCDSIRREDNGKAILIGVYSASIIVTALPAKLLLALFLQGHAPEGTYRLGLRIRLIDQAGKELVYIGGEVEELKVSGDEPEFSVVLTGIPLSITGPGHLLIELKQGDDDWKTYSRKIVRVNRNSSPTESSQPS